ncbi:MAG: Glycosyl transferases group 1 [bacterium ADurb.Bin363]|nr:MAG: Glycosyl transferases group 1 [bacterium ADurb.Bin363]
MKIMMIAGHFNTPTDSVPIGGVQKHITKTTEEFQSRGHEVIWRYPYEAKKEFSGFKPEIVIAHDFFCFIENCPVPQITVFHGYEGNIPPLDYIIKRRLEVEKKSSATICVGEYLKKWYGHNPDKIIWGGVDKISAVDPPRNKQILYLGRLDPDQAPEIAFEAFGETKEKYHIEVCASGKLESKIKKIARKLKLDVNFNGFVTNPDEYIKKADIVICSGYLTILESYINKRPVISPYGNTLKKDYLWLMPAPPFYCNNVEVIANLIDFWIDHKTIHNPHEFQYNFALQNIWDKVADVYEELLEKCLKK